MKKYLKIVVALLLAVATVAFTYKACQTLAKTKQNFELLRGDVK